MLCFQSWELATYVVASYFSLSCIKLHVTGALARCHVVVKAMQKNFIQIFFTSAKTFKFFIFNFII